MRVGGTSFAYLSSGLPLFELDELDLNEPDTLSEMLLELYENEQPLESGNQATMAMQRNNFVSFTTYLQS